MIVIFHPDLSFCYQCFFGGPKCLLVQRDKKTFQIIESGLYEEDEQFIIDHYPVEIVHLALEQNLISLH